MDNKVQEVSSVEVLPTVTWMGSAIYRFLENDVVKEASGQLNNESPEEMQPSGNELGRGKQTQKKLRGCKKVWHNKQRILYCTK